MCMRGVGHSRVAAGEGWRMRYRVQEAAELWGKPEVNERDDGKTEIPSRERVVGFRSWLRRGRAKCGIPKLEEITSNSGFTLRHPRFYLSSSVYLRMVLSPSLQFESGSQLMIRCKTSIISACWRCLMIDRPVWSLMNKAQGTITDDLLSFEVL